jgi:predicted secreted hydrolase
MRKGLARRVCIGSLGCAACVVITLGTGLGAASAGTALPLRASAGHGASADGTGGGAAGVRLPQDEAPHHDPVEWWYFSGHLQGRDAAGHVHSYGFEYVTFQFLGITPEPVYFGDLAVTDLTRHVFRYAGHQDSYPVPATRDSFSLHTGDWSMSGGSGRDVLQADLPGYALDLRLQTTEPAVLHGDDGVIPYGPFGSSYYYSWTSLLTSGTVIDHGITVKVTGLSWMDHQWGSINLASGAGWDWFSMQLSGGQQYMLYFIRDKSGQIVQALGTRVGHGGQVTHLTAASISERATGSWTSPATKITYGSGWQVSVPGGQLTVTPDLLDQEVDLLSTQMLAYWEGDVSIRGQIDGSPVTGVGYTEIAPPART